MSKKYHQARIRLRRVLNNIFVNFTISKQTEHYRLFVSSKLKLEYILSQINYCINIINKY